MKAALWISGYAKRDSLSMDLEQARISLAFAETASLFQVVERVQA